MFGIVLPPGKVSRRNDETEGVPSLREGGEEERRDGRGLSVIIYPFMDHLNY